MPKQKIQLTLPANLHYSSLVRHIADEVFGIAKFSKAWCSRLKLVVDELFMNAVKYGSTPDTSTVNVVFLFDENEIEFVIEDDGTGAEAKTVEELQAIIHQNEENSDITRTSGRGLSMITKLWTDKMKVSKSEHGGIAMKIVKKIESTPPPPPPMPPGLAEAVQVAKVAAPATAKAAEAPKVKAGLVPSAQVGAPEAGVPPAAPAAVGGPAYEVKLSGEIDQSNINEKVSPIYDQIEVLPQGSDLILDFTELDYINSTFIGNLAAWHKSVQEKGGNIRLKNVNDAIKEVLALVGLTSVLKIE